MAWSISEHHKLSIENKVNKTPINNTESQPKNRVGNGLN